MKECVKKLFMDIKELWTNHLKPCIDAIMSVIKTKLVPAFKWVFDTIIGPLVEKVFKNIIKYWNEILKPALTGIIDFITGIFTGDWRKAFNGLKNVVSSIFKSLLTVVKQPINFIIDALNVMIRCVNKIKILGWVPK